jgi:hypothetical protein
MMFARRDRKRKMAAALVRADPGAVKSDSRGHTPTVLHDVYERLARFGFGNRLGLILFDGESDVRWSARRGRSGDSGLVLRYGRRCKQN